METTEHMMGMGAQPDGVELDAGEVVELSAEERAALVHSLKQSLDHLRVNVSAGYVLRNGEDGPALATRESVDKMQQAEADRALSEIRGALSEYGLEAVPDDVLDELNNVLQ